MFTESFFKFVRSVDFNELFDSNSSLSSEQSKLDILRGDAESIDNQIKNATKLGLLLGADQMEEVAIQLKALNQQKNLKRNEIDEQESVIESSANPIGNVTFDHTTLDDDKRRTINQHLKRLISNIEITARKHSRGNKGKSFIVNWKMAKRLSGNMLMKTFV